MFGIMVVMLVAVGLYQLNQQQTLEANFKSLASERGLTFLAGDLFTSARVTGEIDGNDVTIERVAHKKGKTSVAYIKVSVRPSLALPSSLNIAPEGLGASFNKLLGWKDIIVGDAGLDQRAYIHADNESDVRALFGDAELAMTCMTLFSSSRYNGISDGAVVMEDRIWNGSEAAALLPTALNIATALSAARLRPWQRLAAAHGLSLEVQRSTIQLSGQVDGMALSAHANTAAGHATVEVTVPATLPASLRVVSGRAAGAVKLGDPVLDGMVSATGAPIAVLRSLLRDDALRGDLLSVVHAFPGSRVEGRRVLLSLPYASSLELESAVADACRLAAALGQRAETLSETPPVATRPQPLKN